MLKSEFLYFPFNHFRLSMNGFFLVAANSTLAECGCVLGFAGRLSPPFSASDCSTIFLHFSIFQNEISKI